MAKKKKPYQHVDRITEEHVSIYENEVAKHLRKSLEMKGAVAASGIMEFPSVDKCCEGPVNEPGPCVHVRRFLHDDDQILRATIERVRPALREAFRRSAEEVLFEPTATPRMTALREFFLEPKPNYREAELRVIFGDDFAAGEFGIMGYAGDDGTIARETVAGFIRGYIPPSVVGRALNGLDVPRSITNEARMIELPRWLWDAFNEIARKHGWSVSDALSSELEDCLTVGVSAGFEDAAELPDYAEVQLQPTRVTLEPATR